MGKSGGEKRMSSTVQTSNMPSRLSNFLKAKHTSMMCSGSTGAKKLGQPVPESNLVSDENRGNPPTAETYRPAALLS